MIWFKKVNRLIKVVKKILNGLNNAKSRVNFYFKKKNIIRKVSKIDGLSKTYNYA